MDGTPSTPSASRPTRLLAALLAGVALALALGPGAPAGAQDGGSGQPEVVQSWALAPTGTDPAEPSTRPALSYTADPGSVLHDSVTLWNYGNVQLTFRLYATDAFNDPDGSFALLAGDRTPKDVGTWVQLPLHNVTVDPHQRIDLPITITVPPGARPGDHVGAVLASNAAEGTGPDGKVVTVDRRTGTRVYLRVGGELDPQLTITKATSVYHGGLDPRKGRLDVTYTVRNVGNVRLGADQRVTVKSIFGREVRSSAPASIVELLPGNELTVHQAFRAVPATLRATADIRVVPTEGTEADHRSLEAVSRSAGTWAVPWTLVLLAVLLVMAIRVLRRLQRRARPTVAVAP